VGPYSLGQIQAELKAGKILAEGTVIPAGEGQPPATAMTVRQLLNSYNDPAESLFETLRAAKDKRASIRRAEASDYAAGHTPKGEPAALLWLRKIPSQAWMIAALTIATGFLILGSILLMKQSGRMLSSAEKEPAQTVAKPAVPVPTAKPLLPAPRTPPPPAPIARKPTPVRALPIVRRAEEPKRDPRDEDRREDERRDDERKDDRRDEREYRRDGEPIDRDIASPAERGNPGDQIQNPNAPAPGRRMPPQGTPPGGYPGDERDAPAGDAPGYSP
jgi:hypothetical protein